jgi:uncharacterized protein
LDVWILAFLCRQRSPFELAWEFTPSSAKRITRAQRRNGSGAQGAGALVYRATMKNETVLITGASSGVGLSLAREFAHHGHPLVLTAPLAAELRDLAADIGRSFGVNVRTITKDFEDVHAAEELFAELAADRIPIEILVNNAGFGQRGKFCDTPLERDVAMLHVNVEAVVRLTKLFLPVMVKRGHGRILNTASSAGFEPGPMLAVYRATKAFVLSFTEAIAMELEDTPITVTALCRGPVDIDFFPKSERVDMQIFQRGNGAAPQEVARAAYKAVMAGERILVPGGMSQVAAFPHRLLPESAQAKKHEKLNAETNPAQRERGEVEAKAERKEHKK